MASVAALAAPGCLEPEARTCPTGIYCPAGSKCAAREARCIFDNCGDGALQSGETCDDGNKQDGDGCSANCRSLETCGNQIPDTAVGEICDDGNRVDGDGCSADCKSLEGCGDGRVNPDEDCDGGASSQPNVAKETASCNSNCKWSRCGDGLVNHAAGEECDRNGDGQAGTTGESATCNADCKLSRCGDGVKNASAGEACDGGAQNSLNGDCLPASCQLNACGDGFVNQTLDSSGHPKEACDAGKNNSDTGDCLLNCRIPKCGDGIKNGREACDDGNTVDEIVCPYGQASCAGCSMDCRAVLSLTGPYCGDGRKNGLLEECDNSASFICGTCGQPGTAGACRRFDASPAVGSLTVAGTALVGNTFTLNEGVGKAIPTTFEFVNGSLAQPGNVAVDIAGAAGTAAIAQRIAAQIKASLQIEASVSGATVHLTNSVAGISGDDPVTVTPAQGQDTALTATGMTGGLGCPAGRSCNENTDCVNRCECIGWTTKTCQIR